VTGFRVISVLLEGKPFETRLFCNMYDFVTHLEKHLLDSLQPWDRMIPASVLKVCPIAIKRFRQFPGEASVSTFEEVYTMLYPIIEGGIRFSAGLPVYVVYKQPNAFDRTKMDKSHYFVSREGIIITERTGVIRSVRFPRLKSRDLHPYYIFEDAWKQVKGKFDQNRNNGSVLERWVSEQSWQTCPNPHRFPEVRKGGERARRPRK
jgi:hypothetical protein